MGAGRAAARDEAIHQRGGAAIVEERSAGPHAEQARHLEDAAGADVEPLVVRHQRAVVALDAADSRGVEDLVAARHGGGIGRARRGRGHAIEPRPERGLLAGGQHATRHPLREHVVEQHGQRVLVAGPVIRRAVENAAGEALGPARAFLREVPDDPVVAAFGVARGARDAEAGLLVEHVATRIVVGRARQVDPVRHRAALGPHDQRGRLGVEDQQVTGRRPPQRGRRAEAVAVVPIVLVVALVVAAAIVVVVLAALAHRGIERRREGEITAAGAAAAHAAHAIPAAVRRGRRLRRHGPRVARLRIGRLALVLVGRVERDRRHDGDHPAARREDRDLVAGDGRGDVDGERAVADPRDRHRRLAGRDHADRVLDRPAAAVAAVAARLLAVERALDATLVGHHEAAVGQRNRAPRGRGGRVELPRPRGADSAAAEGVEPGDGRRHLAADDGPGLIEGEDLGGAEPRHHELAAADDHVAEVVVEVEGAHRPAAGGGERDEIAAGARDVDHVGGGVVGEAARLGARGAPLEDGAGAIDRRAGRRRGEARRGRDRPHPRRGGLARRPRRAGARRPRSRSRGRPARSDRDRDRPPRRARHRG